MINSLALVAFAVLAISLWHAWNSRRKLLKQIRLSWGCPRNEKPDLEGIADYFLSQNGKTGLDDRTWNDLLLNDVFTALDRTTSSIGQQLLYRRLREATAPRSRSEPHLFIFDELFRGTNAVERIAAGEAVLRTLVETGKPHVVLAATHDSELVDLLRDQYEVCHLRDSIGTEGLTFDYQLMPGPATSRNAIALLKLNGAPERLVSQALNRAMQLDKQRQAATH